MPRILVIEHEWDVDLGLIAGRLASAGAAVDIVGPDREVAIPPTLEGYDGFIVLGGKMDPVDDTGAPWLPSVRSLLRAAVRDQVPTMGVCLGAQLLGMAVGGTARLIPAGPEVAVTPIVASNAAEGDALLGSLGPQGRPALAWHWWEVTDLPAECEGRPITVLASSEACAIHAFRVGEHVWGLQFHLEAVGTTARAWIDSGPQRLVDIGIDPDALAGAVAQAEPQLIAAWSPVVDAWIDVVRAGEGRFSGRSGAGSGEASVSRRAVGAPDYAEGS